MKTTEEKIIEMLESEEFMDLGVSMLIQYVEYKKGIEILSNLQHQILEKILIALDNYFNIDRSLHWGFKGFDSNYIDFIPTPYHGNQLLKMIAKNWNDVDIMTKQYQIK